MRPEMARQNNPQIKDMGRLVPGEKVLFPDSAGEGLSMSQPTVKPGFSVMSSL